MSISKGTVGKDTLLKKANKFRFALTLETVGATNSLVFVVKEECVKRTRRYT